MTKLLGERPIDTYTWPEVNQLRDAISERGLSNSSIRRNFNVLRALVNFVSLEHGFPDIKIYSGIYLGEEAAQTEAKRLPIPVEDICRIQALSKELDDEARWLIALISDTGMRLSMRLVY